MLRITLRLDEMRLAEGRLVSSRLEYRYCHDTGELTVQLRCLEHVHRQQSVVSCLAAVVQHSLSSQPHITTGSSIKISAGAQLDIVECLRNFRTLGSFAQCF